MSSIRAATDVGGTFTDLVYFFTNPETGAQEIVTAKSDTTPPDYERGVMNVIAKSGVPVDELAVMAQVAADLVRRRLGQQHARELVEVFQVLAGERDLQVELLRIGGEGALGARLAAADLGAAVDLDRRLMLRVQVRHRRRGGRSSGNAFNTHRPPGPTRCATSDSGG